MQQSDIQHFLKRYFVANECPIIEDNDGTLSVQLTIDMDKELMNRPFYWHYLEKTNGTPTPMKLTLVTKPDEEIEGEKIHFGSPRLHQLFQSTKKHGSFIRLYEQVNSTKSFPLHPWLCINTVISYQSDRKRDTIRSFGIHLISGIIVESFHEKIVDLPLTPKIPDYCFTISPIIKLENAIYKLQQHIQSELAKENHDWAKKANKRWEEDIQLLSGFYEGVEDKSETYQSELSALEKQYKPTIHVSVINGGIFYMRPSY